MAVQLDHVKVGTPYHCELLLDDGTTVETASWASDEEQAGWSTPISVDPTRVREVRVVGSSGAIRSRATI
jgi:hypothetical protein